jgi:glycerol dehydrogenase
MLENREVAEIIDAIDFCRQLGLPTRLADLGLSNRDVAKIERVAEASLLPGESTHATHVELSVAIVFRRPANLSVS